MGLPQVPSTAASEEVAAASLNTFMQSQSRLVDARTYHFDTFRRGNAGQMVGDTLYSSIGDFQRKTSLEISKEDGSSRFSGTTGTASRGDNLTVGSAGKLIRSTQKNVRNIQSPLSRIVGFESGGTSSPTNALEQASSGGMHAFGEAVIASAESESGSSLVRKRLHSPLNSMLLPKQFDGDSLDIGKGNQTHNPPVITDNVVSKSQDYKKANFGSKMCIGSSARSLSSSLEQQDLKSENNGASFSVFTDGPLLDNMVPVSHKGCLTLLHCDGIRESTNRKFHGAISIFPREALSPPLSLSPLGPKHAHGTKYAGNCSSRKEVEDGYSTGKKTGLSLEESGYFPYQDEEFSAPRNSFEEIEYFQKDFYSSSLESAIGISWPLYRESTSSSQRFAKTFSGLPVRRSLVGSFEESLLSGRLLSGKVTQVCSISMMVNFSTVPVALLI